MDNFNGDCFANLHKTRIAAGIDPASDICVKQPDT
jgi:hypothetical protein